MDWWVGLLVDILIKGDLFDRFYCYFIVVFFLWFFFKGYLGEELKDENDNKIGGLGELFFFFFCEDGKVYIRCYFEYVSFILCVN